MSAETILTAAGVFVAVVAALGASTTIIFVVAYWIKCLLKEITK